MKAGSQKQLISFIAETQVSDGAGGSTPETETYWSTWANVKPLKANRDLQANQSVLQDAWQFTVRFRPDKTPLKTMFIQYKTKRLEISSIVQYELNRRDWQIVAYARD